jgi:hypothetical protein
MNPASLAPSLGSFQLRDPRHEIHGESRASSADLSQASERNQQLANKHAFQTHTQLMKTTHRKRRDAFYLRQSAMRKADGKLPWGLSFKFTPS